MSKPGLPDDAEGQKKLDDFKDKVEEASPPNPPTHRDIWKLGPRNTYKWLSQDCKDKARADAGRIGGLASAAKKAERMQAEKAGAVPDSIPPPIPPPTKPETPEPVIEALGILSPIF